MSDQQVWIFQCKPEIYDIAAALEQPREIEWRTPQQAYAVLPGDVALIWRSGDDAGFVGAGRVLTEPRMAEPSGDERQFYLDTSDAGEDTRVRISVGSVSHVPKSQVAGLPRWASHLIVSAPMGTVFRVTDEQWSELRQRFPSIVNDSVHQTTVEADDGWPKTFAWNQRRKSIQPLPGSVDNYPDTLTQILTQAQTIKPAQDYLEGWIVHHFDIGETFARYVVDQLERLTLVQKRSGTVEITRHGERWLAGNDKAFLVALVHSRIRIFGELLEYMRAPRTSDDLWQYANAGYGAAWNTSAQTNRRRNWLLGFGAIEQVDDRFKLTDLGRRVLAGIIIEAAADSDRDQHPGVVSDLSEPEPGVAVTSTSHRDVSASASEMIIQTLSRTCRMSDAPDEFEKATAQAFDYLGFDATWLGGSGKTDVLLSAPLGKDRSYRVVVDCKTTASGSISDQQINWTTLQDHKKQHEADYIAIVGPAFGRDRLIDRAMENTVSLITVEQLATLIRQHNSVPLGLAEYEDVFKHSGDGAADVLAEVFTEHEGWLTLVAGVVSGLAARQESEGPLSARDLYWLLQSEDDGPRATVENIQTAIDLLANPAIQALEGSPESGYRLTTHPETLRRRLMAIGGLLEAES